VLTANPQPFSVLELISNSKGLRLPQLTQAERNAIIQQINLMSDSDPAKAKAQDLVKGLTIYNTDAECVQYWNSGGWIGAGTCLFVATPTCSATVYAPKTGAKYQVDVPTGASTKLTFLTYNLGATPDLTPKQQMAYVSALSPAHEDVTVYGGLYQWGHRDAAHSMRCSMGDAPNSFTTTPYTSTAYDYLTDFKFVWGINVNNSNNFDWVSDHVDLDKRWGNGGDLATQTVAINKSNGEDINNPCPTGFRVPTQHEWALIGNEDGSSAALDDSFITSTSGSIPNLYTTWVPVKNAKVDDSWSSGTDEGNDNYSALCGYALYKKDVWENADTDYKNGTLSLAAEGAPEPLIFLPSAGMRDNDDGRVRDTGESESYYWSSTVDHTGSSNMAFSSSDVGFGHSNRAYSMSVRCVKE
jgi:hypothetical protein